MGIKLEESLIKKIFLNKNYAENNHLYVQLCSEVKKQLDYLFEQEGIILAVPISTRVKTWESVADKCDRRQFYPTTISDINDIAGIRLITLFQRDLELVCEIIESNFNVTRRDNTSERLSAEEFGYGSIHFEAYPKPEWCSVPTLSRLEGLRFEIQIRTVAQHIWAAASHKLQYKNEEHVPFPLRRSINRTAAILELVDLEFERLLTERDTYIHANKNIDDNLNVDLVKEVLESILPEKNKQENEAYDVLLDELNGFKIHTKKQLIELLNKHKDYIYEEERKAINTEDITVFSQQDRARIKRGLFYNHIGMLRVALAKEFKVSFKEIRGKKNVVIKNDESHD